MAKTESINIRIEPELKREAERTLNDLGMNVAEAITIFLKQVTLTESIPFIIKKPSIKIIEMLANNEKLPEKFKDHDLMGEHKRI